MDTAIKRAIAAAGSVKRLAEIVGVRPQAVSQWRNLTAERAMLVSAATDTALHELRPDIWQAPPKPDAKPACTTEVA